MKIELKQTKSLGKYEISLDKNAVLSITESLLIIDISNYLKSNDHKGKSEESAFCALDVLGMDWIGGPTYRCVGSDFYKNVFFELFKKMRPASQQIGRYFKKAAKKLGFEEIHIHDGRGTKKSAYYRK
ncbi:MAG: hypothetical protein NTX59_06200 [Elusimicrobia bacterium]|nr:hypothetical protein [Elusimicrobiota bacterium]